MLLSILIPTYNYDCRALLRELQSEIVGMEDTEIVVADDCSTLSSIADSVRDEAKRLGIRYIQGKRNSGRSAIRNALSDNAHGQYLLFIDADAMPMEHSFVSDYKSMIGRTDVVCGTVMSPYVCPSDKVSLRWVYDHTSMPRFMAASRRKRPFDCFTSFCFMIRHDVFDRIRFDENFMGYGYEDTLFGQALQQIGASIEHCDIGCLHLGLEPNATFLKKVEESNRTLLLHQTEIGQASSLLRMAQKIDRWQFMWLADWAYRHSCKAVSHHLVNSHRPSFSLLQAYKLLHLCHLIQTSRKA